MKHEFERERESIAAKLMDRGKNLRDSALWVCDSAVRIIKTASYKNAARKCKVEDDGEAA